MEIIQTLLGAVEQNPDIVLEATKVQHSTTTKLYSNDFETINARIIYPESATIKDGWIYYYQRDEILEFLRNALTSSAPCPDYDEDGEGLEYLFGVLKSHLALLRLAAESGFVFVFAELND